MKLLKWIVIGLVAIVVAVGVAGYAVLSTLDIEQYRGVIEAKAEEATGRKLTVAGPMDLAISWTPAVSVEDVSFANADWGSRPEMVTMKRFELEVAVLPLLSGEVQVNRVVLIEPDILLETNAEGVGNWSLPAAEAVEAEPAPGGGEEGAAPVKLQSIGGVRIENGKLTYRDGATGEETRVALAELSLAATSMSSPVEVSLEGAYNDNPISLEGTLGALDKLTQGPLPIDLKGEAGGAKLTVQGNVAEPQAGAGVDLLITAGGDSLKALEPLAGTGIPDLGAYSLSTKVVQEGVNYRLSSLAVSIAGIEAKGGLLIALDGPAPTPRELDLTLAAQGDSVADLGQKVGTDLPDLGAYKVAARITQQGQLFALNGLDVAVGDSTITGSAAVELVDSQPQPRDIDITINTHGESLADVGKLAGTDLPDLGPYKVAAHVSHKDGLFTIDGIDVAVAESTVTGKVVVALVDNAPVPKSIDLRVDTHGESLADVGALVGAELPAIGPYVFATRVTDEKEAYKLSDMTVKMGGSDLAGEVLVSVAGARPSARGSFSSTLLDASDFTAGTGGAAAEGQPQAGAGSDSPYVLTEEPLPLEGLQAADADVKLTVGTLRLPDGLELTGVDLALVLENGKLALTPLVATLAEGKIDGNVTLDGNASPPTLAAKVKVAGLDYGKLAEATSGEAQASGKMDLAIDLAGAGASPRAIASGLDGSIEMVSQQGVITNRLLKIVAVGLTDIMGPLLGGDDQARLNCLVTRFDIADGLATSKALVLDTEVFTVAGAGDVQLKSEQLNLSMDTATRQASLASLAIPFQVKGTMKEPQVVPDPMGAITGLTGAVGSQVKEVGKIGDLIGQMTGKKKGQAGIGANPCVAALQSVGREYQGEIYPETEQPAADGDESAPASLEDQAKGAVQGILDNALGKQQPAAPATDQGAAQVAPAPSGPAPSGPAPSGPAPSGSADPSATPSESEAQPKPEDAVKGLIKGILNN